VAKRHPATDVDDIPAHPVVPDGTRFAPWSLRGAFTPLRPDAPDVNNVLSRHLSAQVLPQVCKVSLRRAQLGLGFA